MLVTATGHSKRLPARGFNAHPLRPSAPTPRGRKGSFGSSHPCKADGRCAGTSCQLLIFARELEGLNTRGFSWSPSMNGSPSGSLT